MTSLDDIMRDVILRYYSDLEKEIRDYLKHERTHRMNVVVHTEESEFDLDNLTIKFQYAIHRIFPEGWRAPLP